MAAFFSKLLDNQRIFCFDEHGMIELSQEQVSTLGIGITRKDNGISFSGEWRGAVEIDEWIHQFTRNNGTRLYVFHQYGMAVLVMNELSMLTIIKKLLETLK